MESCSMASAASGIALTSSLTSTTTFSSRNNLSFPTRTNDNSRLVVLAAKESAAQAPTATKEGAVPAAKPHKEAVVLGEYDERNTYHEGKNKGFAVPRRNAMALMLSSFIISEVGLHDVALAQPLVEFREYLDTFDGYSFLYPKNWIQVKGAGADIFFRDPFVLDENISMEISSPSSSKYESVQDLGTPKDAGKKVLKQYLTEFMSTRLGVRRQANIISTSSRVADDGRMYYEVEVNIKSYANNNELAVMPQERVTRLEWDRRYLSVLGVENNQLYEMRLQTPENVFLEEENDLRRIMGSFRVMKVST